jgi:ZIP family zinc transporter
MITALLISLFAGLATCIGGLLATHKKMLDRSALAVSLSFAAGAMLFVSFVELLPHGLSMVHSGGHTGTTPMDWAIYGAFFVGIGTVLLIDRLLPHSFNPSEHEGSEDKLSMHDKRHNKRLLRSGLLVAFVLALHNFPEGMSTFFASYHDITVGITLAVAIAIHNIPEGIAVAAPVYAATKSRKKAFWWATISGIAEPVGALVGALLIQSVVPAGMTGVLFGFVAGMMVFVAVDELLPAARRYQTKGHQVVYGLVAGFAVVALSLLLL